jgi:hypothetical protein
VNAAYEEWIADFRRHNVWVRGRCREATEALCEAFPELKPVAGWANNAEHWWCVAPDGTIIDPTVSQFTSPILTYVAWKPGDLIRVGRCMNCGEDIMERVETLRGDRKCICSDDCSAEFNESLRSGL